jgi:hypothetical protein
MARIRTIKPEFFTSADILALTPIARLFYVSLWCEADREGLLKWDTDTLKFRYFPKDKVDIEVLGAELAEQGLIVILVGDDGKEYVEIPSFKSHQIINNRESESTLLSRVKHASPRDQGEGKERKGMEGKARAEQPASRPAARSSFSAEAELKSNGVSDQVIADWLALRKSKKATVTATALRDILAEASKAKLTLERALIIACRRGWTGFESSWLRESDLQAASSPPKKDWE